MRDRIRVNEERRGEEGKRGLTWCTGASAAVLPKAAADEVGDIVSVGCYVWISTTKTIIPPAIRPKAITPSVIFITRIMSLKIILYRIPLIRRSRIDVTETTSRRVWDRPWIENWVYNCAFGFIDGVVWVYFCSADYCNIRTVYGSPWNENFSVWAEKGSNQSCFEVEIYSIHCSMQAGQPLAPI